MSRPQRGASLFFCCIFVAMAATPLTGCGGPSTPGAGEATKLGWPDLADYWLATAGVVEDKGQGKKVHQLEGRRVEITGYMVPLENARKHSEFLLTSDAGDSCFFCIGCGPESLIEVRADEPVAFSYELVTVQGQLELLKDDPMGSFFRLVEAKAVP